MKIAIGCDEAGFMLKEVIKKMLVDLGHNIEDYGCYDESPVSYPDIGYSVASAVAEGLHERGILICGTGIGMSITANKVPGIRAAVCHDCYSTVRSRCSNDAQIMCIGAKVIGPALAKQLVEIWLENNFSGGKSTAKLKKIDTIESLYHGGKL